MLILYTILVLNIYWHGADSFLIKGKVFKKKAKEFFQIEKPSIRTKK